jgi:predicted RNA methylase
MSIYNKGDERGILDDLAAFSISQQPLDKTDFKVIRMEINNLPFIYNRFLKSFKKTKGGLQLLVRRKLVENNETLKNFRENMKVPITKAAVSDLLLFFENPKYGGLKPQDIPSPIIPEYSKYKDIRKKFELKQFDIDAMYEKGIEPSDVKHFEKLLNTQEYTPEQQAEFWANQQENSKVYARGISFKENKISYLKLNEHQVNFMNHFIYNDVPGAIMFHGVGTGKTLTAVGMANFYLMVYPYNHVIIASPPALLDNFAQSLLQFGLDIRDNRYTFTTYDKLLKMKLDNLHDTLLIVDEAHNFRTHITSSVETKPSGEVIETATTSIRAHKLMTKYAINAHKVLLMTGTPFVNTLFDIENLITMVNHQAKAHDQNDFYKILADEVITKEYFKYKISHYFNPPKSEFFPNFIDQLVPVMRDAAEDEKFNKKLSDMEKKPFYVNEKMLSNTIKVGKINPKIEKVLQIIMDQDRDTISRYPKNTPLNDIIFDKSIIYTGLIKNGVNQLTEQLKKFQINYSIISGDQNSTEKINARKRYNYYTMKDITPAEANENGVRILIITRAGTEGVDTQWTKNIFLLDGCWNEAANEQIIARAIRFKSHWDPDNPDKKYVVNVFRMLYIKPSKEIIGKMSELQLVNELNKSLKNRTIYDLGGFNFVGTVDRIKEERNALRNFEKNDGAVNTAAQFNKYVEKIQNILNNPDEQKHLADDAYIVKFQSDIDILAIKQSVKKEYADKFNTTWVKLPLDIKLKAQKEIDALKKQYWEGKGKKFTAKNNVGGIMANLESSQPSIELYLYLTSNAKQQTILEFVYYMDHHIKNLEDLDINKEQRQIIDEIVKTNYAIKRPMKDDEKYAIVNAIRKNSLDKTTNILLNENYNKSEVSRFDMLVGKLAQTQTKKQEKKIEKSLQEYFTPLDIALKLIELSDLKNYKNKTINILEPTAGEGGLVAPILKYCLENNINIGTYDLCEYSDANRNFLKKTFSDKPYINVSDIPDFFNFTSDTRYDVIIMNPPYNITYTKFGKKYKKIDLDFVLRAYQMLKAGGNLVALVYGPHISTISKIKAKEHQDLLNTIGAKTEIFMHDWVSTQQEGQKKVKINKLELGIVMLNAAKNKEYEPITPINVKIEEPIPEILRR